MHIANKRFQMYNHRSRPAEGVKTMIHPFEPFFDRQSRILILGSFPSVASRAQGFYYGHPRNRFWRVTSAVFGAAVPHTVEEKKDFLRNNHIALWDVACECEIVNSDDSTIKEVVPANLSRVTDACSIEHIFVNGKKAFSVYERMLEGKYGKAIYLPSTSPANAAWSVERLIEAWRVIVC